MTIKKISMMTALTTAVAIPLILNVVSCGAKSPDQNTPPKPDPEKPDPGKPDPEKPPKKREFSNLLVLGDSLSDQGTFQGLLDDATNQFYSRNGGPSFWSKDQLVSLFVPRGMKLSEPYFDNRSFTNGKPAVEILANMMKLESSPAWNFPKTFTPSGRLISTVKVGTNYATAKSTISPKQASFWNYAQQKVVQYLNLENQVSALLEQHKTTLKTDLIYLNIGHGDLIEEFTNPKDEEILNQTSKMLENLRVQMQRLIDGGAQDVIVSNIIDLTTIPKFFDKSSEEQNKMRKIVKTYNENVNDLTKLLNTQNKSKKINSSIIKVHDLNWDFGHLKSAFADEYKGKAKFENATTNPSFWSFWEGELRPEFRKDENGDLINKFNMENYFFFDEIQPNAWVHQKIAEKLYKIVNEIALEK